VSEATPLLIGSRSAGKIRELLPMIRAAGLAPVTLEGARLPETPAEDAIEAFDTFEENALAKARYFSALAGGVAVLADDSGLAVDALGGAPGVRSKRWAAAPGLAGSKVDDANNRKLISELTSKASRRAKYVCVAVIAWPGGEVSARGECAGSIATVPSGDNGFGYDPFFVSDELGVSFGDATIEAKEAISHRGRAMRAVLEQFAAAR
jgi:XTP/dITP diphosphohydrolase